MLERIHEQQLALHEVARLADIDIESSFSTAQWNIAGHIKFVLWPFKDITDTLSTATCYPGECHSCSKPAQEKICLSSTKSRP